MAFKYNCTLCGAEAKKEPLLSSKDPEKAALGSLGSWRCTKPCKRAKVKVRRTKV